jgi:hypothetical protein
MLASDPPVGQLRIGASPLQPVPARTGAPAFPSVQPTVLPLLVVAVLATGLLSV